jgi:hypothetical protein
MPDRPASPIFDVADEEVTRYRAISPLAVISLLAGLLSPLALFGLVLWFVPLVAVVLSAIALGQIANRWPTLVGHRLAMAGLMLGVAMLVAAPVDDQVFHYFLRRQARQFAGTWIEAVRQGEVYKAHQLMVDPRRRLLLEVNLADHYRNYEPSRRQLRETLDQPTVRTLFALGKAANIRFYETATEGHDEGSDLVQQIYAVTYPDEQNQLTTFFIAIQLRRTVDSSIRRASWTVAHVEGGVHPTEWADKG